MPVWLWKTQADHPVLIQAYWVLLTRFREKLNIKENIEAKTGRFAVVASYFLSQ